MLSMMDCIGGFSKSITSLHSPEVSGLTALASFAVYEGDAVEGDQPLNMLPTHSFANLFANGNAL